MDAVDALGRLAKGEAPPGFAPIPNSKHGGYRKRVGSGYQYWYPDGSGGAGGKDKRGGDDRVEGYSITGARHPLRSASFAARSTLPGKPWLRFVPKIGSDGFHVTAHKTKGAAIEGWGITKKPAQPKETAAAVPKRDWIASVTEIGLPADTQKAYQKDGEYTPERQALHEKVYSKFLDHVSRVPDSQKPVAVVMMGGSASGKGTVVRHVMGDHNDFVNVNPDDCKEEIPEYKQAINLGESGEGTPRSAKDAALMAHEESSDMADEIRKRAVAGRKNLILDGTGKNAEKYAAKIHELKEAGYHVRLLMPHVDMQEAQKRAKERAQRSGRYVPDDFVEMAHHLIPGNFETVAAATDEAVLFDNRKPPPRPVWTIDNQNGTQKIHDPNFVSDFKRTGKERHAAARDRGWLKKASPPADTKSPSVTLEEMLERMKTNRGEAPDNATGLEDEADVKRFRASIGRKVEKSMDAIDSLGALTKGFPPGRGNNVNDDPAAHGKPSGAPQKAKPGSPSAPGGAPGNAGQPGQAGEKPQPPAKPGEGKPGAQAQTLDEEKGSVQYPTKVKNPETGEFEFVYLDEGDRDPEARFVVSDETGEGAHWELPQDSEDYDAFKQWKAARKKGLQGEQIPKELVAGAMAHAEKHHYDSGPHKAAYDDHLAHQGNGDQPQPPPTHHTMKQQPGASHPAMQGDQAQGGPPGTSGQAGPPKPGAQAKPPAKPGDKRDLIGKLADFARPHEPTQADVAGGVPSGISRSGTEHATSGEVLRADEDEYQSIYGNMHRSMDAIDDLAFFAKAKYKSRTRGADGKWKYTYEKPGKETGKPKSKSPHVHSEGDKHYADSHLVNRAQKHMGDMALNHMGFGEFYLEGDRGRIDFNRMAGKEFPGQSGRSHLLTDNKGGALVRELIEKEHASAVPEAESTAKSEAAMRFTKTGYDSLRKGLYAFDLSGRGTTTPVPDNLLYDYLCAFIEEACEHESREREHRQPMAGEDFYQVRAVPVLHELVQYLPKNANLARAAKKFSVGAEVIAEIMKKKGLITPPTDAHHDHGDYWSHDWDSLTAMGINDRTGPTGEVLMASDARYGLREDPEAVRPLTLRDGPAMVHFGYEGHSVSGVVERASRANIYGRFANEPMAKANFDSRCLVHGEIHKQQIAHETFVKCSCPR